MIFVTPHPPPKNYNISSAFSYNLSLALTLSSPPTRPSPCGTRFFADATVASAILDRVLHHCTVINTVFLHFHIGIDTLTHEGRGLLSVQLVCDNLTLTDSVQSFYFFSSAVRYVLYSYKFLFQCAKKGLTKRSN